jgi:hypothetical protein
VKDTTTHSAPAGKQPVTPFFGTSEKQPFFGNAASAAKSDAFFHSTGAQPKLEIGGQHDPEEAQAEETASRVVQGGHSEPAPISPGVSSRASLHRKAAFESEEAAAPNEKVQAKGSPNAEPATASPSLEAQLHSSKGGGMALPPSTKHSMESAFGHDFSGVKLHNNSSAAAMNNELGAQAFTHGNDIYFNDGKYNPEATEGKHLLAHELTHTLQQTGGVNKKIQRSNKKPKDTTEESELDLAGKKIKLKDLQLPQLKGRNDKIISSPLARPAGYTRKDSYDPAKGTNTAQLELWKKSVEPGITTKVDALLKKTKDEKGYDSATGVYYLKNKGLKIIGKRERIIENAKVPTWNIDGKSSAFDADHIKELQLGGENVIDNLELLNFSANRASGSLIKGEIERQVDLFLHSEKAEKDAVAAGKTKRAIPSLEVAKKQYEISFQNRKFNLPNFPKGVAEGEYWSFTKISTGEHLKGFTPMKPKEIEEAKGSQQDPVIYGSEIGGRGIHQKDKLPGVSFSNYTAGGGGEVAGKVTITVDVGTNKVKPVSMPLNLNTIEGVIFGGYIPRRKKGGGSLESILSMLTINALSPVTVDEAMVVPEKGILARGRIHPTLNIIKGVDLDFFIEGDEIGISKTISAGDLEGKIPKPFKINGAFLTIGLSNKGAFVQGDVLFEIEKLGSGKISGLGKSNGDFGIKGRFDFDKKLFKGNAASIDVEYNNKDGWMVKGELLIGDKSVKGVKSGKITVGYANNTLEAFGTAELTLKGVEEVTLRIKFAEGISELEGGIKLGKLPGIKDGEGQLKLVKTGDEYDFSGSGKITPDIPGLTSQVAFAFHNEIFLVDAKVAFEKGRLKGSLNVGVTNQEIDTTGKPTGKALPQYKVYGESELALKVTDKITVTAGVKLLENGEIEVRGGIKLPPKIEVVPKLFSVVNKPLIEIPEISFPLFGIPLGVTTLGLEATISPYVKANAQVGPGYLANTQAEVVYNPAHPDEMTITGGADFEFIAEASIHAGVDFGVGVSVGIAAAKGGINLDAYIKVAAEQPIFHADIKYSPNTGFELAGNVKAIVAAILGFSGNLFLNLRVGYWPLKKTWRWEKELFRKEIDTGLQIGFEFPFGYKNGQADVSFEKMKFIYPKFDRTFINSLSDKLVKPVVDSML